MLYLEKTTRVCLEFLYAFGFVQWSKHDELFVTWIIWLHVLLVILLLVILCAGRVVVC